MSTGGFKLDVAINQQEGQMETLIAGQNNTLLFEGADGQYFVPADGQILVNEDGNIVVNDGFLQLITEGTHTEVEEENGTRVIYYTNGGDDDTLMEEAVSLDPNQTAIVLDKGDAGDFVMAVDETEENEEELQTVEDFQYAVLKDGKLHIQQGESTDSIDFLNYLAETNPQTEQTPVDISKITGRNLLTGQTVSLDSYLRKQSLKEEDGYREVGVGPEHPKGNRKQSYRNIINKKLVLGRTNTGKKLVGKILKIERPAQIKKDRVVEKVAEENGSKEDEVAEAVNHSEPATSLKSESLPEVSTEKPLKKASVEAVNKHLMTKDSYDYVIKMLVGLMQMDSVQKKLLQKNVLVKLVEKSYESKVPDACRKRISYLFGYMALVNDGGAATDSKWMFILVNEPEKAGMNEIEDGVLINGLTVDTESPYNETTSLTLIITSDYTGHKTTRVNLSPRLMDPMVQRCPLCQKAFKNVTHLSRHIMEIHQLPTDEGQVKTDKLYQCETCQKTFDSEPKVKRHMLTHFPEKKFQCTVCSSKFYAYLDWKCHMNYKHPNINTNMCEFCGKSFLSDSELVFHRKVHDSAKQCSCYICGRQFTRHSNLLRHVEIHKGGALYRCDICGCSYNYVSSLTRHLVQSHISKA